MSIDNKPRDDSDVSLASTPERDQNGLASSGHGAGPDGQQPKRKGGRKPVSPPRAAFISVPEPEHPLTFILDLCYLGGAQATEQTGSGRLPGAQDRVYQAARGHHPRP